MRVMALKDQLPLIFSSWVVLGIAPRGKISVRLHYSCFHCLLKKSLLCCSVSDKINKIPSVVRGKKLKRPAIMQLLWSCVVKSFLYRNEKCP